MNTLRLISLAAVVAFLGVFGAMGCGSTTSGDAVAEVNPIPKPHPPPPPPAPTPRPDPSPYPGPPPDPPPDH